VTYVKNQKKQLLAKRNLAGILRSAGMGSIENRKRIQSNRSAGMGSIKNRKWIQSKLLVSRVLVRGKAVDRLEEVWPIGLVFQVDDNICDVFQR
jgi:hypothetical protein